MLEDGKIRKLIGRLNDIANERQTLMDRLWTLENNATALREELLNRIEQLDKQKRAIIKPGKDKHKQ